MLAGGLGRRLGGVSKADLDVSGRLLDRVLGSLAPVIGGRIVVVAPEGIVLPAGVLRAMEAPAGGGPLAGVGAGLEALDEVGPASCVLVTSVDSPGIGLFAHRLFEALHEDPGADGAIARGGAPEVFDQYLQGAYRTRPLVDRLRRLASRRRGAGEGTVARRESVICNTLIPGSGKDSAQLLHKNKRGCAEIGEPLFGGGLHGYGVRRALSALDLVRIDVGQECRDLDTPEDLAWWRGRLAEH